MPVDVSSLQGECLSQPQTSASESEEEREVTSKILTCSIKEEFQLIPRKEINIFASFCRFLVEPTYAS
jgi:hypothetical protein